VHIQLQDITQGQVVISIHDDAKRSIVAPVSSRPGDVISFKVRGQEFFLHVRQLENQLIGDDRAILDISAIDRWSSQTSPAPAAPLNQQNSPVQ
jgi:hypothetical protein